MKTVHADALMTILGAFHEMWLQLTQLVCAFCGLDIFAYLLLSRMKT